MLGGVAETARGGRVLLTPMDRADVVTPGAIRKLTNVKTGSTLVTDTIPTITGPAILRVPKAEVDAIPDGMIATGPGTKLAVPKALVGAIPTGRSWIGWRAWDCQRHL